MTRLRRIGATVAGCMFVAGCAIDPARPPTAAVTAVRMKVAPADRLNTIVIGRSTKADVLAALGETLAISFDSGYEVWAYRLANTKSGELVVLFAPSGVVAKTRIRPEA